MIMGEFYLFVVLCGYYMYYCLFLGVFLFWLIVDVENGFVLMLIDFGIWFIIGIEF